MLREAPITRIILPALLIVTLLAFLTPDLCFAWSGKVVGVSDGDTITVMHDGRGEKIRLYGIDCPENRQVFGKKAKKFTSDIVFGKVVEVEPLDIDRYGTTVGLIYIGKQCVNSEILRTGMGLPELLQEAFLLRLD